jgi:hypothetical protein
LEVFDGAVGAAAVDGVDLVELIEGQAWDVELAALQFVPDEQTEGHAECGCAWERFSFEDGRRVCGGGGTHL